MCELVPSIMKLKSSAMLDPEACVNLLEVKQLASEEKYVRIKSLK